MQEALLPALLHLPQAEGVRGALTRVNGVQRGVEDWLSRQAKNREDEFVRGLVAFAYVG
jgi:hypothetical protein